MSVATTIAQSAAADVSHSVGQLLAAVVTGEPEHYGLIVGGTVFMVACLHRLTKLRRRDK